MEGAITWRVRTLSSSWIALLMLALSGFKCRFEFCYVCLASYKPIQLEGNGLHDPSCKHHTNNINYGDDAIPDEDLDDLDDEWEMGWSNRGMEGLRAWPGRILVARGTPNAFEITEVTRYGASGWPLVAIILKELPRLFISMATYSRLLTGLRTALKPLESYYGMVPMSIFQVIHNYLKWRA